MNSLEDLKIRLQDDLKHAQEDIYKYSSEGQEKELEEAGKTIVALACEMESIDDKDDSRYVTIRSTIDYYKKVKAGELSREDSDRAKKLCETYGGALKLIEQYEADPTPDKLDAIIAQAYTYGEMDNY